MLIVLAGMSLFAIGFAIFPLTRDLRHQRLLAGIAVVFVAIASAVLYSVTGSPGVPSGASQQPEVGDMVAALAARLELTEHEFPPSDWNIYCFQFSDGDNWGEDSNQSLSMLRDKLLPVCNLFCYGQVESPYGSGDYIHSLESQFGEEHETLVLSEIPNKDGIYDSIRKFLGKGK